MVRACRAESVKVTLSDGCCKRSRASALMHQDTGKIDFVSKTLSTAGSGCGSGAYGPWPALCCKAACPQGQQRGARQLDRPPGAAAAAAAPSAALRLNPHYSVGRLLAACCCYCWSCQLLGASAPQQQARAGSCCARAGSCGAGARQLTGPWAATSSTRVRCPPLQPRTLLPPARHLQREGGGAAGLEHVEGFGGAPVLACCSWQLRVLCYCGHVSATAGM
jgi:hypothetical protein